jgi:hypothetical protein
MFRTWNTANRRVRIQGLRPPIHHIPGTKERRKEPVLEFSTDLVITGTFPGRLHCRYRTFLATSWEV